MIAAMGRAEAEALIHEGACEHPWVDAETGVRRWVGGYCHDCWDKITAIVPDDDPIWDA